jgi:hypothetical protein
MKHYDVFNGDADGICALHQLRLAAPTDAVLVTGVKSDVALLERVPAAGGDSVTVLDISLDANRAALLGLLARGVTVQYFDHHGSGAVPAHPGLDARIDTAADTCTALLVDRHLGSRHRAWAVVGAFGDNLAAPARALARALGLGPEQTAALQELGECLNYNAYGDTVADLLADPAELYRRVHRHADPFDFMRADPLYPRIRTARDEDLRAVCAVKHPTLANGRIVILPDAARSRRVRGIYANRIAGAAPGQAHALAVPNARGGYTISVRAPLENPHGAAQLCRRFGGDGRAGAASIPHLPCARLEEFAGAFEAAFGTSSFPQA